jgi:hypothetical protein
LSLLKVREGKYKRGHGGHRWYLEAEKAEYRIFKPVEATIKKGTK